MQNVLVSDTGKVILTDLGSVRRADRVLNSRKDVRLIFHFLIYSMKCL